MATLTPMNVVGRSRTGRQVVTRAVVAIAAAFILLALHDAVATASHEGLGTVTSSATASTSDGKAATAGADAAAPGPDGSLAGECGLAIMCVVALASVGGLLLLRRRRRDSSLWSVPRVHLVVLGATRRSYLALTPLQRTCVLRC